MPLLTPHGKHLSIQNLLAISTMMSPFHHRDRSVPIIQAGGGHAASNIPDHHFYLSNAIQDHFKHVYQQHCGKELTLSREALVNFLGGTQVQSIDVPPEPATYGFEEFLKFLWSNHALDAMREAAPKDLSRPISNYFISSSHNTYLSGNQLSSKSSTDAYKNVLLRGCRCIEIDVWNGEAAVAESVSSSSLHKDHPERSHSLLEKVASKVENKVEKVEKKLDHAVELLEEKTGLVEKPTKEEAEATEARQRKALELERSSSQATTPTNVVHKSIIKEKEDKEVLLVAGNNSKPITKEKDEKDSLPVAGNNNLQKIPSITSTDPHDDFNPPELQRAVPISVNPRTSTESLGPHSRPSSRHSVSSAASTRPEPRVLHGWTLTSDIGFRDVCRTVRETAFQTTDLPIIVSLEVHADLEQQEIMVDIMKEEWAGHLIDVPYESCDPEQRIPRLEELRNKILVKVKKAAPQEPTKIESVSTNKSLAPVSSVDSRISDQSGSDDERSNKKKKTKAKICDSLSRLGIYTRSTHFTKFEAPEAKSPPHIFSVAEDKILELHETRQNDLFSHNRDFFMRAYPAGRRFDSSNLDPSVFWRKGVQMVALNWQTWDEAMMLNEGMFAGENGWVLKPRGYRSIDAATNQAEAINHMTLDLKIKIFAAQHVPLPLNEDKISGFHPYVKCELHVEKAEERLGLPIENGGKTKEGAHKQQSQTRKGIEPDWNGEQMVFYGIPDVVEELSFVRFKIQDDELYKDHLAAWACIRLDRLEQGYRFIRLFDAKGAATAGMLLVQVEKISRK